VIYPITGIVKTGYNLHQSIEYNNKKVDPAFAMFTWQKQDQLIDN